MWQLNISVSGIFLASERIIQGEVILTANMFEDSLCSVWGQLGWDALIYNPCFCRRGMLAPPALTAPDCSPPLRQAAATPQPYKMRASCKVGLWKERPPHAKTLRLCVEVCCSLVAEILNLSSSLWITLNSFELSLLFFWVFLLLFFSVFFNVFNSTRI